MNKRLIALFGIIVCFALSLSAIERVDSTVSGKGKVIEKEMNMQDLLADVPSGDPDLYSYDSYDGTIPRWVLERINSDQAALIKKFGKGYDGINYTMLLSILGDSIATKEYFEKFRGYVSDSARNEREASFQSWVKAKKWSSYSVSAGFPSYRLDYPMSSSVEGCQLCSYPVYSPVNGDDIHLVLDVVFKQGQNGEYKVLGQYLYLTGALSKNAIWASNTGTSIVSSDAWDEKGYGMFPGSISGYISYFKDGKPKQVMVNLLLTVSPK